jgi:hypothetical protein
MYKGIGNNTLYVERASMKKEKKGENNMTGIRFIETRERTAELMVLLDRMLSFLAEMPVDKYHDYRIFRHTSLREYLIHQFLHKQLNKS